MSAIGKFIPKSGAECRIHYPGASVGAVAVMPAEISVEEALNRADASMYAVKRQRRAAGEGGNPPPSSQVSAPR